MLTINTNLSSIITQNSLKTSTQRLNQAIERMSTGFKINHAKDNAANYSISTNIQTKLNAYNVAADNVAMGMDLVTTASDTISLMQDYGTRLQALATQARNGTYGTSSMEAINTEAAAIMAEINRLYSTAEYNNISLFNRKAYELTAEDKALTESLKNNAQAKAEFNGFIADPKHPNGDAYVESLTAVKDATLTSGGEYKVASKEDLIALAEYVNDGNDTSNMTFIMSEDIDLSSISNWTPIGNFEGNYTSKTFNGTFDGNGHVIKNLTIDKETEKYQGLFGYINSGEIKNIVLENVNIKGYYYVGGLVGYSVNVSINNSYVTGVVRGTCDVGGLVGFSPYSSSYFTISNSYTMVNIDGHDDVGGLVGNTSSQSSTINNCYATGNVSAVQYVGGLVGASSSSISNSYATGNVKGGSQVGGLVGHFSSNSSSISNSYATGNVSANQYVGGLVGATSTTSSISNSYATGNVKGEKLVGGLIGGSRPMTISECNSYSSVKAIDIEMSGTFIGAFINSDRHNTTPGTLTITNCQDVSNDNINKIGGVYRDNLWDGFFHFADYDMTTMLAEISDIDLKNITTNLLVGINGGSSCQIVFDTNFSLNIGSLGDLSSDSTLASITEFQKLLNEKSTQLGAVQNRLESALDSIEVNMTNLTSSLSTIRDADLADESSEYIRQQILQQASSTLLATANQSPSIALQLI